jgi:hypothetical protein
MQQRCAIRILGQRQGGIRHGQSIADDQYRVLCGQCLRQFPRIMPIRFVIAHRLGPRQQRRERIPQRQNHSIRDHRGASRERRRQRLVPVAPRYMPNLGRLGRRTAQQVGCQHRAAETGADDDYDVSHRLTFYPAGNAFFR